MSFQRCARLLAVASTFCVALLANAQINQWSFIPHMKAGRQAAAAVGDFNAIYAFGGTSDFAGTAIQSAELYIPSIGIYEVLSDLPFPVYGATAVNLGNGHIILLGGFDSLGAQQPYYIDYSILDDDYDAFSVSLPVPGALVAAALGNDNNLYVLLFNSGVEALYRRDLTHNTWTFVGTAPSGLGDLPVGVRGGDGLIYFMGGVNGLSFSKAVYSYDAIHDVWAQQPSMNTARAGFAAVLGGDKHIYAFGGITDAFVFTGSIGSAESFKPGDSAWTNIEDLETARGMVSGAADPLTGRIYAVGGELDGGDTLNRRVLDTVETLQPSLLSGSGDTFSATEGTNFSGAVATFTVSSLIPIDYDPSDFTASINWGDGTPPTVATVSGFGDNFTVSGAHTYAEAGSYVPLVTVVGAAGEQIGITGQQLGIAAAASVTDAPLTSASVDFSASSHVLFSGKVANFSDGNADATAGDLTATIDWGDATFSSGTITADPSGGFDVTGAHVYSAIGNKVVKVKISDVDGATTTVQDTATVVEPPPSISAQNISGTEGVLFSGQVASFSDADGALIAGSFTASISWGDGVTSSGLVSSNGVGGFNVSGSHNYSEEGSYTVTVAATVAGQTGSSGSIASISDAPIVASGFSLTFKGTNFANTVASFTDADPAGTASDYTAAIFWGDGKYSNGVITAAGSGFRVAGIHSYAKKGKYTVTITIRDAGDATASATTHINAGPVK